LGAFELGLTFFIYEDGGIGFDKYVVKAVMGAEIGGHILILPMLVYVQLAFV
jgi:hypothetical protein